VTELIAAVVFLVLAVGGLVVRKTYYCLPVRELKRRAQRRDLLASKLYRAVAYGRSLRALLWVVIALCSSAGFVLLARVTPVWLSLVTVALLLWVTYSWLPARRTTQLGTRLTIMVTPTLAWVLNYTFPLLDRATGLVEQFYRGGDHTGLFERADLIDLIERQAEQADSRVTPEELEIVKRALSFDDHTVGDIVTPAKHVKTILANDAVGPILINELYQQGQEFVLVRDSREGPVIGLLECKRLDLKSNGLVRDLMNPAICYLHEQDSLSEALHAFTSTNCPLFVVVNNAAEYTGVVSTQNVLRALLGQMSADDFDQYTDLSAVAARHRPVKPVVEPEAAEVEEVIELA
jgi:CBS domain containing-hemolysin-like protein